MRCERTLPPLSLCSSWKMRLVHFTSLRQVATGKVEGGFNGSFHVANVSLCIGRLEDVNLISHWRSPRQLGSFSFIPFGRREFHGQPTWPSHGTETCACLGVVGHQPFAVASETWMPRPKDATQNQASPLATRGALAGKADGIKVRPYQ